MRHVRIQGLVLTSISILAMTSLTFARSTAAQTPPSAQPPAASAATPSPTPEQAQILKNAEAFIRNLFSWGPQFQVKLGPLSPSPAPDFYTVPVNVTYNGQNDVGVFFVSKDGKTVMRGDLYDLAVDPFAENRSKIHTDNSPSLGSPDAPITLVEFSDFECPHCRELFRSMKMIEPKYPMVRVVFKDFPISQIHPWAETAAIGARCAYMQSPDAFWQFHDALFENQDVISSENVWDKLQAIARRVNLDPDTLKACMASPEAREAVRKNLVEGQSLGVNSTPTVFINGRPVIGGDKPTIEQFLDYQIQVLHLNAASSPPSSTQAPPQTH